MIRVAALCALLALPAEAQARDCRQALALGLDVSGSVDAREYRQQIDGLAAALADPQVRERLLSMPGAPVRLMVYEWSGPDDHAVLLGWREITDGPALDTAIEVLRQTVRRDTTPGTALGEAMLAGARHLAMQSGCWKRTLDLSGDGESNLGPRPRTVRAAVERTGITVNALAIGVDDARIGDTRQADVAELSAYFRAEVILGPGAFVLTALGYADYARAMRLKLLRELEGPVLSSR